MPLRSRSLVHVVVGLTLVWPLEAFADEEAEGEAALAAHIAHREQPFRAS